VQWINERPSEQDLLWLKQEAQPESKFDTLFLRPQIWEGYIEGRYILVCKSCPYAKVLVFVEKGKPDPTPWAVWGEIFQIFGENHQPWRIGYFPAKIKRTLPDPHQPVGPENVNGGYTMPCSTNGIVIYRKEEATRVLLHELFHASCCDRPELCLEKKEAETEAWAELVLIAYLADGKQTRGEKLLQSQLEWMAKAHATLRTFYNIQGIEDYIWRYTIAREDAFCRLGIEVPITTVVQPMRSSRLTHPSLEI
jgi:hypothetical protein